MNRNTRIAASLTLALGLCATAAAQSVDGFFLQARAGSASATSSDFDKDVTAAQITGGYRWGAFGVEAGYVNFNGFEGERDVFDLEADVDGFTLGGNFRAPFGTGWYFGARAGAFFWQADADTLVPSSTQPGRFLVVRRDESSTDLYAGVSLGYDFNEQVGLGLAYDYFGPEGDDVSLETNVLSVVGEIRF